MTNAKLFTLIWKRQTLSSKREKNMVTWSHLPFAVCCKRDAKSHYYYFSKRPPLVRRPLSRAPRVVAYERVDCIGMFHPAGGVLRISSDGDDRMRVKIKTHKNP